MTVNAHPQSAILGIPRPTAERGLVSWLTTVDHKRIGILYGITALFWFFWGGLEAVLIRTQLAFPNGQVVSADTYNELFTMHGTTMIFLVVMPLSAAFFNYLIPLMIGARDVAFPRLNAFSYWMYFFGGIFLNTSWFVGQAPNGGWFGYASLTEHPWSDMYKAGTLLTHHGIDFWTIGLQILGISSVVASLNFIVTIINMRAPGMTMMRLPVFVWMTLVTAFLVILAFPFITIALLELTFDRQFDTMFFNATKGGFPIYWQHLFWVFGHPEVYILILPAMGIVSEILPVFSRKPLFGYPVVVFSGAAIGFMGFTVWSHHMFTTGMGAIANAAFSLTTMAIAVPTGVKIFNWVGTLWGGQIRFKVPLLYAVGFISMFMIGGFSGLMHSSPPGDAQQQDTYFIVAHFHYVLIGGSLFALFGGIYYWFPKFTGRLTCEKMGRFGFWLLFVGFNVTFFPMHWLGLNGMPRRIYTYPADMGWNFWNLICTIGVYTMLLAFLVILHDLLNGYKRGAIASNDPWDGRTLEWTISSPPPVYNFATVPVVHSRDELWYRKYPEAFHDEAGHEAPAHGDDHGHHDAHGIHMPGQSWFPLLASFGF
ncbi:MAG: cytochrome c oxidase subunit I, partial [Proteobacteria bacterium]|nr:cytochrome c oxidase subunit I [Pseudomonadota bacterium]